jgi:2-methylisocitrate lyase-like PEP mutase family enzyme
LGGVPSRRVDLRNELDPNFVVMAQCYARDASEGTLEDTIARLRAYREEAGVDWVQFESPHSVDEIKAARAAVTGPFSFMKGKLGRYLDLHEHLALGVAIAWYPGFTHRVTWAELWDFMTTFQAGGVKAWDALSTGCSRRRRQWARRVSGTGGRLLLMPHRRRRAAVGRRPGARHSVWDFL